jgi:hypothetical protein
LICVGGLCQINLGGIQHYVVGSPESKRAIIYIYDIFGALARQGGALPRT